MEAGGHELPTIQLQHLPIPGQVARHAPTSLVDGGVDNDDAPSLPLPASPRLDMGNPYATDEDPATLWFEQTLYAGNALGLIVYGECSLT
jgi:hypothetical protein